MSVALRPTVTASDPVRSGSPGRTDRRRPNTIVMLLPLQLFLVAGWGRAAIEKAIDPTWWSSQHLRGFLAEQRPHMLPWFRWLSDHLLEPFAPQVAVTVLALQLGIAACLATNFRVRHALWIGVGLNLCFTMAGRVNPSAFYLVMQLTMLFALSRPVAPTIAVRRAILWMVPATLVLPFARTVHPREVIDDPALMLSFLAITAAVTTLARSFGTGQMLFAVESTRAGSSAIRLLHRFGLRFDLPEAQSGSVSSL